MDRYAPDVPFPKYAFVPGRHPHPVTDPRGHSFGKTDHEPQPLDPNRPLASLEYLFAIDLFNAGYYWEAHEAWEALWVAAGRAGPIADFAKALIKLAAAGVKAREGQATGVQRHARRALELLHSVRSSLPPDQAGYAGLSFDSLMSSAKSLVDHPTVDTTPSESGLPVIGVRLVIELTSDGYSEPV